MHWIVQNRGRYRCAHCCHTYKPDELAPLAALDHCRLKHHGVFRARLQSLQIEAADVMTLLEDAVSEVAGFSGDGVSPN